MVSTHTCNCCGRVATSVRADMLSHCCKKTTYPSVEIAVEIPIPKWRFGTDFIAVVCRGKVVDILLLSDRTSVHTTLHECQFDGLVQGFVDNLQPVDESREATDIEVKYGNNVYVVRQEEGAPRIFIPAISNVVELGDSYLSASEREAILALARSTPSACVIEISSGQECGIEAQCSSTGTIGDAGVGAAVERRAAHGIAAEGAVRAANAGLRNTLKQLRDVAKRIFELVLRHKTPSLLAKNEIEAQESAAALKTECDTPLTQAEDGSPASPQPSVQTDKPQLISELPKRNINFSQHLYHRIARAFGYVYVDRLETTDENCEATEIEVKCGDNLPLVRLRDDVPPALSEVSRDGDVQRVSCRECEMVSINGVPSHEGGCPNEHKPSESRGHLIECSSRYHWRYLNWITGRTARLIDNSASTLKTRLALNALRNGSNRVQLTDQFRRVFKRQEDEARKYYEDSVSAAGDEHIWRVDWDAIAENALENAAQNPEDTKHGPQPPEFRFRLNGDIIPASFIQPALVNGEPVGEWQVAVDIDGIGKFTIDDTCNLWDSALPEFVLEFRDETSWVILSQSEREASKNEGWQRVTPQELIVILQSEGFISAE